MELQGFREQSTTNIVFTYEGFSITNQAEASTWCKKENDYLCQIFPMEDHDYQPLTCLISDSFKELELVIKQQVSSLSKLDNTARFSFHFFEQREKVCIDGTSDTRYSNSIKLVIKSKYLGAYVNEFWFDLKDPIPSLIIAIDRHFRTFNKQAAQCLKASHTLLSKQKRLPVVMPPKVAGQFIHEAIGHLLEADIFSYVGQRLSNSSIYKNMRIYDDPTGYEAVIGLNKIDDLGAPVRPIDLISKGSIKATLNSADYLGVSTDIQGCSRSSSSRFIPIPRMRMTITERIKEAVRPEYSDHILLNRACNGSVIPMTSNYHLKTSGYLIRNSTPVYYIPELHLSSDLFSALSQIDYIGNDPHAFCSDCIKNGQIVRVGYSCPTIYLKEASISGKGYSVE